MPNVNPETGTPFSRAELASAFELVSPSNWKDPINRVVAAPAAVLPRIREAVVFFTGSVPKFTRAGRGRVRVKAAGYYAAVGA